MPTSTWPLRSSRAPRGAASVTSRERLFSASWRKCRARTTCRFQNWTTSTTTRPTTRAWKHREPRLDDAQVLVDPHAARPLDPPLDEREQRGADERVDRGAQQQRQHARATASSSEKIEASQGTISPSASEATKSVSARAARAGDQEAAAGEAHHVADDQLRERREPEHPSAEEDVLHPAGRDTGQHAVRLAAEEGAGDDHEQERIEEPAGPGHEVAERRLDEHRGEDGRTRPEGPPHCTERGVSSDSCARLTTSTSSSRSKRADGSTRISRNSPEPSPTKRTRPTTSPFG